MADWLSLWVLYLNKVVTLRTSFLVSTLKVLAGNNAREVKNNMLFQVVKLSIHLSSGHGNVLSNLPLVPLGPFC